MRSVVRAAAAVPAFWLVVVLLGILAGCATLPPRQPVVSVVSGEGETLLAEWRVASASIRTLQGLAKVRVRTPERSVSGTQVLLAESPDRLRAETLSPFGTTLLVVTTNEAELAVSIPGDNMFYRGRATPENLGRFTRLPLRPADLVGVLLARPPQLAYRHLTAARLGDGGWLLTLEAAPRRQELRFDAARRLVETRYLHNGELQLQLTYAEFGEAPPHLPGRIELELPLQQTLASLVFTESAANRQLLAGVFAQSPPQGATVALLDEMTTPQSPPEGAR